MFGCKPLPCIDTCEIAFSFLTTLLPNDDFALLLPLIKFIALEAFWAFMGLNRLDCLTMMFLRPSFSVCSAAVFTWMLFLYFLKLLIASWVDFESAGANVLVKVELNIGSTCKQSSA